MSDRLTNEQVRAVLEAYDPEFKHNGDADEIVVTTRIAVERAQMARGAATEKSHRQCAEPGCDVVLYFDGDTHCEGHERDEYGVRIVDCYCWQSPADNADIEVCSYHRQAFERY